MFDGKLPLHMQRPYMPLLRQFAIPERMAFASPLLYMFFALSRNPYPPYLKFMLENYIKAKSYESMRDQVFRIEKIK